MVAPTHPTSAHTEPFVTDRYELGRCLGAGGMGVVYEAFDRECGTNIALKVLRAANAAGIYRFKREFRSLADVCHPNLATLYELVNAGDQWFFTLELIDGESFLSFVRGAPSETVADTMLAAAAAGTPGAAVAGGSNPADTQPASSIAILRARSPRTVASLHTVTTLASFADGLYAHPASIAPEGVLADGSALHRLPQIEPALATADQFRRLRDSMIQVAEGLIALHRARKLHRDIKPSNVLVDRLGRVVILDFGIVAELSDDSLHERRQIAGTPAYMAPEQINGASAASDWYAVGVMLYEALAGRRPYAGDSLDVLEEKRRADPPPIRDLVPGAPADLCDLCTALLSGNPADRPLGPEVIARLGESQATSANAAPITTSEELVGREREIEALRAAFQVAGRGSLEAVHVHGTSGMGKSALVARFLDEFTSSGDAVVLAGRCYERESVPYKALDALIDAMTRHLCQLRVDEVDSILPRDMPSLVRVFPVLGQLLHDRAGVDTGPESDDPQENRRRAIVGLRALWARLAARRPLVLYIDDAQWGDFDSALLLRETLRQPAAPPVLFIISYRSDEAADSSFVRMMCAAHEGARNVPLGPLSFTDARTLASTLLRTADVSDEYASSIARESAGNAFFVTALARHAARVATVSGELRLEDALRSEIEQLPASARALLELISVAGHPIAPGIAMRAAALGKDGPSAVAVLRGTHLVRSSTVGSADRIETYHDRIRESVVSWLPAEQRRGIHLALARCLEAIGSSDAEAVAAHWEGAGEIERAAEGFCTAGARAADALAFDRAAELFARSLALQPRQGAARAELMGKLGDALANAGRGAEAADSYICAADEADDDQALDLRARAAEQLLRSGHIDAGMDTLRGVMTAIGTPLPRTRFGVLCTILRHRLRIRRRGFSFAERQLTDLTDRERSHLELYFRAMAAMSFIDPLLGLALQSRHLGAALDVGEPSQVARALSAEANFRSFAGPASRAQCDEISTRAVELAHQNTDLLAESYALYSIGFAAFQLAEYARAHEVMDEARSCARRTRGGWWETGTAEHTILWIKYYLGDVLDLTHRVQDLLREAEARGDLSLAVSLCIGRPSLSWLVRDDVDGARQACRFAMSRWTQRAFHVQHVYALMSEVHAHLYEDNPTDAWRCVDKTWRQLVRSTTTRIPGVRAESWNLRARAALAAATEASGWRRRRLLRIAERATGQIERDDTPLTLTLVPLNRSAIAHARGDRATATAELERAIANADLGNMKLYAAAARRQLGILIGGTRGQALISAADAWMTHQDILNPAALARVFAPQLG